MLSARSAFLLLLTLIAIFHFGHANHDDDDDNDAHLHTGRCKKHHPEEYCKDFCDTSICDDGDCVCKSDWKGSGSSTCRKAIAGIRSRSHPCEEVGTKYNTCPFVCTATSLKNKVKPFCVVWEGSGPCKTGGGRPRPTTRPTKPPRPGNYDPAPRQGEVEGVLNK